MEFVINNFTGKNRLWVVFWLHNLVLGTVLTAFAKYVTEAGEVYILVSYLTLAGFWAVWVTVGLWRCAFNTDWPIWGYAARIMVVVSVSWTVCDIVWS